MTELVSIHIPKTAGSSLFRLLKLVYGREAVTRINTMGRSQSEISKLKPGPGNSGFGMVIHGHIRISELEDVIRRDHPKIITWMRDPVDRVISNYYFAMNRIREGKAPSRKAYTINYSLTEYAAIQENRNRAAYLLENTPLDQLFFIGLYEQYEDDIRLLGNMLGWPENMDIPHLKQTNISMVENNCKTQFQDITDEMRNELARLNSIDVDLYRKVKTIRNSI